jgi:hypothetical protein
VFKKNIFLAFFDFEKNYFWFVK